MPCFSKMPFSAPTNIGRWPKLLPITTSSLGNSREPAFIASLPDLVCGSHFCVRFIEGRRQGNCNRRGVSSNIAAVGATLVVAPFVERQQGDHKGRPYIILTS